MTVNQASGQQPIHVALQTAHDLRLRLALRGSSPNIGLRARVAGQAAEGQHVERELAWRSPTTIETLALGIA
jgi:hypothetical protein